MQKKLKYESFTNDANQQAGYMVSDFGEFTLFDQDAVTPVVTVSGLELSRNQDNSAISNRGGRRRIRSKRTQ